LVFDFVCASVHPSVCLSWTNFKSIVLFLFLNVMEPFLVVSFPYGTLQKVVLRFLPCDAVCTVSVIVILSVRLSVRLSVTLVDCVHMVRPTITISTPQGSPIILVSGDITIIPKFEGGHPERAR